MSSNKSNTDNVTTSDAIGSSDTASLVASILPKVRKQVEEELASQVMEMISHQAREAVAKSVREHFEAHIGPQVKVVLEKQNAEIVAGVVAAIAGAADEAGQLLAKSMRDHAVKVFTDPYKVSKILEMVYGRGY